MAYVRTRTSMAGTVSTALMKAYRDDQGRPRQRLIVNLHGEPDALCALAKLTYMRKRLVDEWNESVTTKDKTSNAGWRWRREKQIDRGLAVIERDKAILEKHCSVSAEELYTAMDAFH